MDEYQDAITRVKELFSQRKYDQAETLLQECINQRSVDTLQLMEQLRDSTDDHQVKDKLVSFYFFNYV